VMIRLGETGFVECSVADCALIALASSIFYHKISYNVCMKFKLFLVEGSTDKAEFNARFIKFGAFARRFLSAI
jgi:hypothetical protein